MQPTGLRAFAVRTENRSCIYAYEQRSVELVEPYAALLRERKAAWDFFQKQPASYRKMVYWWIISAKREETRLKRLEELATFSAEGRRLLRFAADRAKQEDA